jgi:medium-chain acyl-[acyl-carrier-protein] hydrolase
MGCIASRDVVNKATAVVPPPADAPSQPVVRRPPSRKDSMSDDTAKKWLILKAKKPNPKFRMLCMGWAGSSSNAFKTWDLKDVELLLVELPARNARFSEPGLSDVQTMAKRICQALSQLGYLRSTVPLVVFGHSFGAMMGLHVARTLKKQFDYVPRLLVFAGCRPLHVSSSQRSPY